MATERIDAVIPRVLQGMDAPTPAGAGRGLDGEVLWSRMVDEKLRAHTHVARITGDCLVVKADGSGYLQQLHIRRRELLEMLVRASAGRFRRLSFTL